MNFISKLYWLLFDLKHSTVEHPLSTASGVIAFAEIAVPEIYRFCVSHPNASALHLAAGILLLLGGCWFRDY